MNSNTVCFDCIVTARSKALAFASLPTKDETGVAGPARKASDIRGSLGWASRGEDTGRSYEKVSRLKRFRRIGRVVRCG